MITGWTGFYMTTASVMKGLSICHEFPEQIKEKSCCGQFSFQMKTKSHITIFRFFQLRNSSEQAESNQLFVQSIFKSGGVPKKTCPENMQQIYRKIEITLWHGCSPVNLLHIFRTPFFRNTPGSLLLHLSTSCFEVGCF